MLCLNVFELFFQDQQVIDLAQDLANKLGLKGRKAYVSLQTESTSTEGEGLEETSPPPGEVSFCHIEKLNLVMSELKPSVFFRCLPTVQSLWATLEQVQFYLVNLEVVGSCQHSNLFFLHVFNFATSDDLSSAQCIPAPLATPIPVSDDPTTTVVTSCTELSESPSSQALPPMPYSVPVSEHMDECGSGIKGELDSILECMPNKVSEVSKKLTNNRISVLFGFITCLNLCLLIQSPVQGAIPTNLPNTAVGLRPPYSPRLPAPSPQLPPAFFSSSISEMPALEVYTPLCDQGSTQAQDALGSFSSGSTDGEGKGASPGGLDSLSEYTLPGDLCLFSFPY